MSILSRRRFLVLGLGCACGCLLPAPLLAASKTPKNYYAENRDRLLAAFADTCTGARALMADRLGARGAADACAEARVLFARLLSGMPDVGGAANRNQPFIEAAGQLTTLHLVLSRRGFSGRDTGRLYYDLNAQSLAQAPAEQLQARGAALFSAANRAALAAWAEQTQKRRYPGDWVATFVPGNGAAFDLGYDYTECGALKYFRDNGAEDVAPYFCINDFLSSKAMGTGLFRKGTLASGADRCDFRYKQGGPVTQDWDTEAPTKFA